MLAERLQDLWARIRPFHLDWIQVEVSGRCQGRCAYCPVSVLRDRRRRELMSRETFQSLLPSFPAAELVFLQGWGEPLLHPDFWTLVRQTRETGVQVGFTTNGVHLDRANREALLESDVDILGVSVAGTTSTTHGRYRAGNGLEILDRNLRALENEKRKSGASRPNIHLAYLLLADHVEELSEIVDLGERWGVREIVVSPLSLVLTPELERQSLLMRPEDGELEGKLSRARILARELLAEVQARGQEQGIRIQAPGFGNGEACSSCNENILRSCFVSAAGEVSPCVMSNLGLQEGASATHRFQGRDVPVEKVTWGNVRDRALRDIWLSPSPRRFRKTHRERIWRGARGRQGLPHPCHHCYKLYEC